MLRRFLFIILILSTGSISISSYSAAEEISPVISEVNDIHEGGPPQLTRNPFLSAPYGRMYKKAVKSESDPSMAIRKNYDKPQESNKIENISKDQKVKGVILDGYYPVALLGHRIVKVGDLIGKLKVTDITREGVSASDGDRVINLPLE